MVSLRKVNCSQTTPLRLFPTVRCFPDFIFCASPTSSAISPLYVSESCWRASFVCRRCVNRREVFSVWALISARCRSRTPSGWILRFSKGLKSKSFDWQHGPTHSYLNEGENQLYPCQGRVWGQIATLQSSVGREAFPTAMAERTLRVSFVHWQGVVQNWNVYWSPVVADVCYLLEVEFHPN